jgi:hypothetical protein
MLCGGSCFNPNASLLLARLSGNDRERFAVSYADSYSSVKLSDCKFVWQDEVLVYGAVDGNINVQRTRHLAVDVRVTNSQWG